MPVQRKRLGYEKGKNVLRQTNKIYPRNYFWKIARKNVFFKNNFHGFFINKGFLKNDNIAINVEDESATDQAKSAIRFKSYNINIVESTSGLPPFIQVNPGNKNEDNTISTIYNSKGILFTTLEND